VLYPSCFDANAGLFESVLTKDDAVVSDALNHASIIDGIRLCKARGAGWTARAEELMLQGEAEARVLAWCLARLARQPVPHSLDVASPHHTSAQPRRSVPPAA